MKASWLSWLLAAGAMALTLPDLILPFYSAHPLSLADNMQDTGAILTMTRELLKGRTLYAQIFTPYGPVPHGLYEAMAWFFGNTALTYAGFVAILCSIVYSLEYVLMRRYLPVSLALGFYILVLSHFNTFTIIYSAFETIGILLLAIFWIPPVERTVRRSAIYGLILGLIHFSKFGSDVVAGAAFLLLDLIYFLRSQEKTRVLRAIWRGWVMTAFSFAILFLAVSLAFLSRLSTDVAKDVLWPLYLAKSYSRFAGVNRYPQYLGVLFFTKFELPMLIGLGACLASLVALVTNRNFAVKSTEFADAGKDDFPYPFLFPPLFFLLACFVLLAHAWHYYQYGVYAALGALLALRTCGKAVQRLTLLIFVPYLFVAFWTWIKVPLGLQQAPALATIVTPIGYALEGPPELVSFYQKLFSATDEEIAYSRTTAAIISLNDRPGIYYFSGREVSGRIIWYLPMYLRPWEEDAEERNFRQAGAIILGVPVTPTMNDHFRPLIVNQALRLLFSPGLTEYLERRLTHPIFVGIDPSERQVADWTFAISSGGGGAESADVQLQPQSP